MKSFLCSIFLAACALLARTRLVADDLPAYLRAVDPSYRWESAETQDLPGGKLHVLKLTSQTWQGIPWQHYLAVIQPEKIEHPEAAMLVISGGSNPLKPWKKPSVETLALLGAARQTGSVIAILSQVPNQPLYEGRKEDALIALTFLKFLDTKDASWPLLLPMVKSAMRAMDAVQAFGKERLNQKIEKFFLTGASKRGWTTWLTGALDSRVIAIAPMVIDTLNMKKQMPHQIEMYGKYSEEIADYTNLNLQQRMSEPGSEDLMKLVDPYSYLKRLQLPKFIILGTNDPYWTVDAVNLYYFDLQGEKHIHYVPNAGHGLNIGVATTVAAFYHSVINGLKRPEYTWDIRKDGESAVVAIRAPSAPRSVRLWTARSLDKDFRNDRWESKVIEAETSDAAAYNARTPIPAGGEGYLAQYAELVYPGGLGADYSVCTSIKVFGKGLAPETAASGK